MKRQGIERQTLLIALLPILLMAVLLESYFIYTRFSGLDGALLERARLLSRQVAASSEFAVFSGDTALLKQYVEAALAEPDVAAVSVIGMDGDVLARGGRYMRSPENIAMKVGIATRLYQNAEIMLLYEPITITQIGLDEFDQEAGTTVIPGRQLGAVIVEIGKERLSRQKREILLFSLLATSAILLVTLLVALWGARRITHPILEMNRAIRSMGEGNLHVRIDSRAAVQELDELADGFNRMAEQLQQDVELLETRVEESTRDLRESRESLALALAELESTIETNPDIFYVIDTKGELVKWNSHLQKLCGLPPEQMKQRSVAEFVCEADRPLVAQGVVEVFEKGSASIEVRFIRHDGALVPYLCNGVVLKNREGGVVGFAGAGRDITERKQAEEELRLSEERYRTLYSHTPVMLHSIDANGVLISVSDYWLKNMGYEREEVIGHKSTEFMTEASRCYAQEVVLPAFMHTGVCKDVHYRFVKKDGTVMDGLLSAIAERDAAGNFVRSLAVVADITERLRSEEALLLQSEITAHAAEGIALVRAGDSTILYVNRKFEEMFDYASGELLGQHVSVLDAATEKTPQEIAENIDQTLRVQGSWSGEILSRRKNGAAFWSQASISTFLHPEHGALWISYQTDISERKQLQAEWQEARELAEAASRAKSEFLANMSHEIRTPLNSILGLAQLLQRTGVDSRQRDYLDKLHFSGEHLLKIIDDILDFSKIDAGRLELERTDFDLDRVMENLGSLVSGKLSDKALGLEFEVTQEVPRHLHGDPFRLNQVLVNLVGNAIKFTESGQVTVRVAVEAEEADAVMLRFEVQDTGIGLTRAEIDGLFQAFHQADSSISRKYGGSGLGLAISRQLVALMDGEMGVESENGKGSTFWFTVRLEKGKGMPLAVAQNQAAYGIRPALSGRRILLAEDSAFNRQVAREFLEDAGAIVCAAENGEEALELLRHQHFDCVLMDVQMPLLDGLEATRIMRADPALAGVTVVAMTANASKEDRERCMAAGMDDFISKPYRINEFYATLARWLSQETVAAVPRIVEAEQLAGQEILDEQLLLDLTGDDREKARGLATRFVESARSDLAELDKALARGEQAAAARLAHRARSPAGMVGAAGFARLCRELEKHLDEGNAGQARTLAARLHVLLDEIENKVSAM